MTPRFGNYRGINIDPNSRELVINNWPEGFEGKLELITHKMAISLRDELITQWLANLGVKRLLDVGCDFGSLLAKASLFGINSYGLDIDKDAIELARKSGLNIQECSIEQIIRERTIRPFFPAEDESVTAVSCLNILHGKWDDPQKRKLLLEIFLKDADFVFVTLTSSQLRQLRKLINFQVVGYLGVANRPMSRWKSQVNQYGLTFFFRGRFHKLEKSFWEKFLGRYRNSNPIATYIGLVVILTAFPPKNSQ
jgi:SAM-dependent methyltransferase